MRCPSASDRLRATVAALSLCALATCGTAPSPSQAGSAPRPDPRTSVHARSLAQTIPTTWSELETLAHRIYVGTWSLETAMQPPKVCVTAVRVVHGDNRPGGRTCEPTANLLTGVRWDPAPTNQQGWVFTTMRAGREAIQAIAPSKLALLRQVRCRRLDNVWSKMPARHRACSGAVDCELLQSPCFATAVTKATAAPYRDVIRRVGGTCIDPAGGVCPATRATARCVNNRCTAVEP